MERLDANLDRLHHGGEALLFRGEPGIGKSALLKHASWRAAESGFRTLATVGMESEAELAFAVRCCTITVHVYDAVVMGAGKAGLSAS
jgi:predicted ATP-dependent serine protease